MSRLIVVGASLGGVSALMQMAAALPADFPAPILAVLHVGEHRSSMPALLSRRSPLSVSHAEHEESLENGHIYLAPPDHHMLVFGSRILLSRHAKEHHTRPAVDPLFRSAALAHGADVIGVVLTGGLDDGTAGLQAIKQRGGTAIVQDPRDAFAPGMPESALKYVEVDHCLPLALIPRLMTSLASMPALRQRIEPDPILQHEQDLTLMKGDAMEHLRAIGSPSTFACPDCHGTLWSVEGALPSRYRCHTGHGFTERTLQEAMEQASDEAAWSAVRALQERGKLLEQMSTRRAQEGDAPAAERLRAAAASLEAQVALLRELLENSQEHVE